MGPRAIPAPAGNQTSVMQPIGGCIQKFLDWPPGVRSANGTALCH